MEVEWAGYNNEGNDRRGHLHVHHEGTFIRGDGLAGFYCCAPLEGGECFDPPPALIRILQSKGKVKHGR